MNHTGNYKLNLPEYSDSADIEKLNENFEIIDSALHSMTTTVEAESEENDGVNEVNLEGTTESNLIQLTIYGGLKSGLSPTFDSPVYIDGTDSAIIKAGITKSEAILKTQIPFTDILGNEYVKDEINLVGGEVTHTKRIGKKRIKWTATESGWFTNVIDVSTEQERIWFVYGLENKLPEVTSRTQNYVVYCSHGDAVNEDVYVTGTLVRNSSGNIGYCFTPEIIGLDSEEEYDNSQIITAVTNTLFAIQETTPFTVYYAIEEYADEETKLYDSILKNLKSFGGNTYISISKPFSLFAKASANLQTVMTKIKNDIEKETAEEISTIESGLSEVDEKVNYAVEKRKGTEITAVNNPVMSDLFEFYGNYMIVPNGSASSNGGFLCYKYNVTADADIYITFSDNFGSGNYCRMKIYEEGETVGENTSSTSNFYSTYASDITEGYTFPDADDNRLLVTAGQTILICISTTNTARYFTLYTGSYNYTVGFTDTAIDDIQEALDTDRLVHIIKENESLTISIGKAKYIFKRFTSDDFPSITFVDTWRWTACYAGGGDIPLWTSGNDSECPMMVIDSNTSGWISGYHGYEQMVTDGLTIIADGTIYDVDDISSLDCRELSIIVESEVYYPSDTTNVAFTRYKKLDFKYGLLTVSNSWKYTGTRDSTIGIITWYGGLFPVHLALSSFNGYSLNCSPKLYNNEAYNADSEMTEAYMYGDGYTVRVKTNKLYSSSKGNVKYTSGTEQKVYFAAISASSASPYVMNNGDRVNAEFEVEIR